MKTTQSSYQSASAYPQRSLSYFERNFSLMGGHYVAPTPEPETFPQYIVIRSGSERIRLNTKTINSIEAAGDYMCFNCQGNKTHIVRKTMKQLQDELNPQDFIRIHRSNMINKNSIVQVSNDVNGELTVVLANQQTLSISRRYKNKVTPLLSHFIYN